MNQLTVVPAVTNFGKNTDRYGCPVCHCEWEWGHGPLPDHFHLVCFCSHCKNLCVELEFIPRVALTRFLTLVSVAQPNWKKPEVEPAALLSRVRHTHSGNKPYRYRKFLLILKLWYLNTDFMTQSHLAQQIKVSDSLISNYRCFLDFEIANISFDSIKDAQEYQTRLEGSVQTELTQMEVR